MRTPVYVTPYAANLLLPRHSHTIPKAPDTGPAIPPLPRTRTVSNHASLRYRNPVYLTLREMVMS